MRAIDSLKLPSGLNQDLLVALGVMGIFAVLLLFGLLYYRRQSQKVEFQHFRHMLSNKELSDQQIHRLYKALKKSGRELHLILESEEVMKEAAATAGLDENELRVKLGFDTDSMVQKFLQRQQELRKKWNAR